jgi:Uma2 family endonuclease
VFPIHHLTVLNTPGSAGQRGHLGRVDRRGGWRALATQANLLAFLRARLRGTSCRPYGSDLPLRVSANTVRYPDVAIYCEEPPTTENDDKRALSRPRVIFEVLSGSTANVDQGIKLAEYQDLSSVEAVVFVDPDAELVRVITRLGPQSFRDDRFGSVRDVELPGLGLQIPHEEIFARD